MKEPNKLKIWIEAMRLRTLPVSVAGVFVAGAYGLLSDAFSLTVFLLCILFAVLCQVASNFANEYYDFLGGLDRPGRDGPRRGVTEGDISARAMLAALVVTLVAAAGVGVAMVVMVQQWWLVAAGAAIFVGVWAYSAGPYPLSHHGLGEVAVVCFFGIVPVNITYYLMTLHFDPWVFLGSVAVGLMGANVLIVNNYRDREDDEAVGKHTMAVIFGRKAVSTLYLFNGFIATALMTPVWLVLPAWTWAVPALYLVAHTRLFWMLTERYGRRLNPLLGMTAVLMLALALGFFAVSLIV